MDRLAVVLMALVWTVVPRVATASCQCGYAVHVAGQDEAAVFTDSLETDFTRVQDFRDWQRQQYNVSAQAGRGQYGKAFVPANVASGAGLELRVGSAVREGSVTASEVDTTRRDLHWGSYRAGMRLTSVNGTCASFFWYFNDTQEIDMEFLSREYDADKAIFPVNLVVQSSQSMAAGYDAKATGTFSRVKLGFDPTAGYHEYRIDYMPGHVSFYADSQLLGQMQGSAMPRSAGHVILQHWSNGNPLWSGGPPAQDAVMAVSYVKAYFNSSQRLPRECAPEAGACVVPGVTAANASTGGAFMGHQAGHDDDESSSRLESAWLGMTVFMAVAVALWADMVMTA